MHSLAKMLLLCLLTVAAAVRPAAGIDLGEVGAMLVYPTVATFKDVICVPLGGGDDPDCPDDDETCPPPQQGQGEIVCFETLFAETFVTITNAGPAPVTAHVAYINGFNPAGLTAGEAELASTAEGGGLGGVSQTAGEGFDNPMLGLPQYCDECDFDIALTPNDTETLVLTFDASGLVVQTEDDAISLSCPFPFGMMVVTIEDAEGNTLTDNVLLGEQVVVDYVTGSAFSVPAVSFQGGPGGDGDRRYALDGNEYARMPRVVAANFLAPQAGSPAVAALSLFTLGFDRRFPPLTDCSVTGFDARERSFSASFQFGCWQLLDLCSISPEFCYPNLGLTAGGDTHGWLQLNCRVDQDPQMMNGFDGNGGVHGAIIQYQATGTSLPAGSGGVFGSSAAWGRLLQQSVTSGDPVTLELGSQAGGMF